MSGAILLVGVVQLVGLIGFSVIVISAANKICDAIRGRK